MKVTANFSALRETRWYEYLSRFLIGGVTTALAGIIAKKCGPSFGGLFLAFPSIFPASATLIENHEKKKGRNRTVRGRRAAALDAAGATLGAFGLATFAGVFWRSIEQWPPWAALLVATAAWLSVSVAAWKIRETFF